MFEFLRRIFCFILSTACLQATHSLGSPVSLEELRSFFRIENNVLINSKEEMYFPYPFKSELHSELAFVLKDLKQSEIIHNAYQQWIAPVAARLDKKEEKAFRDALLKVCLLFGNSKHSPRESFFKALECQGEFSKKWLVEYLSLVEIFINQANESLYSINPSNEGFTIVILTTSCSGGNLALANALSESLESFSSVKVIQIDTEEIAKEIDPVMIATGVFTYEMIYSSIFQKTNDFSVIPGRKKLSREIHRYIPSDFLGVLKSKIQEIKPDLIISTRSYLTDDMALASLGVPFRMMQADFELCPSLNNYYRGICSESARFWLFNAHPPMFKPIFETYNSMEFYDSNDSYSEVMEKMAGVLQVPVQKLKDQFEVIGYPISTSFSQIKDQQILKSVREKWGVKEEEFSVFITMGKHGASASKDIFNELINSQSTLPLKYFFICGKNDELKNSLHQTLESLGSDFSSRFVICGLLSPEEMNEIMNICSLGISKAGSAAVLETMATEGYLLLMNSYPWEKCNGVKLVELGCGFYLEPNQSLISQIEKGINLIENRSLDYEKFRLLKNWRSNLKCKIDLLVSQKFSNQLLNASLKADLVPQNPLQIQEGNFQP